MVNPIPVNPALLTWARETAGLSIKDVVDRLDRKRISTDTIADWESGLDSPNYVQLKELAYKIYKRPLAVFFFPSPPQEETPKQSFRTLPDYELEALPSRMRILIRDARAMLLNLRELYDNESPAKKILTNELNFSINISADQMGDEVRKFLKISIEEQVKWSSDDLALKSWRNILEDNGIFIFKDSFQLDDFSGFCLYDEVFPIIYVNNNKSKYRQIFTLFHELAHLLFKTGGIDTREDNYIGSLEGNNKLIEILCNKFAGELLVPTHDILEFTKALPIEDSTFQKLSKRYNVSREVILRKYFNLNLVSQDFYNFTVEKWKKAKRKKKSNQGDYYKTKGSYLGEKYLTIAFKNYYQNKISQVQLAEYLGVKAQNLPGMEQLLYKKAKS